MRHLHTKRRAARSHQELVGKVLFAHRSHYARNSGDYGVLVLAVVTDGVFLQTCDIRPAFFPSHWTGPPGNLFDVALERAPTGKAIVQRQCELRRSSEQRRNGTGGTLALRGGPFLRRRRPTAPPGYFRSTTGTERPLTLHSPTSPATYTPPSANAMNALPTGSLPTGATAAVRGSIRTSVSSK